MKQLLRRLGVLAAVTALALVAGLSGSATASEAVNPNGQICTALKGNTATNAYDIWMDSGRDLSDWFATPAPGYCSNNVHPGWTIISFSVGANRRCTSQWGYTYADRIVNGQHASKQYTWTGDKYTRLVLTCIKTYVGGSWVAPDEGTVPVEGDTAPAPGDVELSVVPAAFVTALQTGTVSNGVGCFTCGDSVWTSPNHRPNAANGASILPYSKYRSGVAAFMCVKRCKSQWGYEYPLGYWVDMTTTGTLVLYDV
jgi:hypothetical protein